jgi:hypothetical protein
LIKYLFESGDDKKVRTVLLSVNVLFTVFELPLLMLMVVPPLRDLIVAARRCVIG